MWRTILLGKLGVSILASLVVGGVCISRPWRVTLSVAESSRWIGAGAFFLLLAIAQIAVIAFLAWPKKRR